MKKLGFGCMRLPVTDREDPATFDYQKIEALFDTFIEQGFTYFDTAYVYHDYKAERALCRCLTQRHKRESYLLATKLPMRDLKCKEDQEKIFEEQLQNCGVDYFDYYLLHNLGEHTYRTVCKFDSFEFGLQKKAEGKIRNFGFSFHDSPELLDEILTAHPEADFVQLQINYIDWENPGIQSRKCYEIARKHNKPVIVMEPCKGGNLANLPKEAEALMRQYDAKKSPPSWAIRFAAGLDGVIMVLSGMNTMEQLRDNISYMREFQPLEKQESEVLEEVVRLMRQNTAIPCTTCRYCTNGCPKKIAIPDYFALYNSVKQASSQQFSSQFVYYLNLTAKHGKAGDCIGCGQCERTCPQHLKITDYLKEVSAAFDGAPKFPSRK